MNRVCFAILLLLCAVPCRADDGAPPFTPESIEFFEKKIRPLLVESCYECHAASSKKIKGGLRVDSRAALITGGDTASALAPGDPTKSLLIEAISYRNADLQMPPKKKLSDAAIADLMQWVKMGAPWPAEKHEPSPLDEKPAVDFEARKREHWAWQPVKEPQLPKVKNEAWVRSDIDRFILARLEARGLSPSPQADRRTLIRRVTFDLIGLPPTANEVEAFLADTSQSAYEKVIDRLLASPQYGERWARHWLDVVRYADSKDSRGMGGDADITFAWRYRDWVIDALNRDLPYDQFITQQIAGDLMVEKSSEFKVKSSKLKDNDAATTPADSATQNSELRTQNFSPLIATTMLAIGNWDTGDSDKRKMMTDIVDDQIDVISRGFLGMTIACARCHDHKFDPISTRDYYALAGFFFSSHIIPGPGDPTAGSPMLRLSMMSDGELAAITSAQKRIEALKEQINAQVDALRQEVITRELGRMSAYLSATEELYRSEQRDAPEALSAIAAKHGIHAAILKRFVRYIGLAGAGGTVPGMFTTKLSDVGKSPFVMGWGEPATPSILAHTGSAPIKILTFTLPPRSIAMHPSPTKQAAIGWRSKFNGTVSITGSAADADAACGNGFAWSIIHQRASVITRLAQGSSDNGGSQKFPDADTEKRLESVHVQIGDLISLIIDARGKDHICDNTTIEFTLSETTGAKRKWDVTADVVDSILVSNPHADTNGQRDIWHFYAISDNSSDGDAKLPAGSLLAQWLALLTDAPKASDEKSKRQQNDLKAQIHALATIGQKPPANLAAANLALHKDLTTASSPLWSTIDLPAYSEANREGLIALRDELKTQTRIASTKIQFTQGIAEGGVPGSQHAGIADAKVHGRGRYDRLGETVKRGYPALIAATPEATIAQGSGRMELAQWIASPDNIMTARVMVNRLWQHHFGRGLVSTPDNFGHLGSPPTHPELLDYLAAKFTQQRWSIKAMHRVILLSASYQQESRGTNQQSEISNPKSQNPNPTPDTRYPTPALLDPDNTLLWRQSRHRLDAEQLRDALLAVSGQLDRSQQLTSGPGTGDLSSPRRSIYLLAVRSDRSTFRTLFDAADPTASIHIRNESTIAPQALFMLNHPFALATAKTLTARMQREAPAEDEKKIHWLYQELYARPATPREIDIGLRMVSEAASGEKAAKWQRYCQVLLCANEFLYAD